MSAGFEVATAINAEAGLEMADNVRPSAIILDMRMPITNGCRRVENRLPR